MTSGFPTRRSVPPDAPSVGPSSCPNVPAGSWSEAASSTRHSREGCRCCCCSIQGDVPVPRRGHWLSPAPFQCHNLLVLQGALREQQLNQPLDAGGSLHPTRESIHHSDTSFFTPPESIRRTVHQSGPESLESAITGPGTCTATWGVTPKD